MPPLAIVASVFARQEVREVSVGELNRSTSEVLRSINDGERLIVSRHGEPMGIVLSVRDAVEAMVEPDLGSLEPRLRGRCPVEASALWRRVGSGRLAFSEAAERQARAVIPIDRVHLQKQMDRAVQVGLVREPTLVWSRTGMWVAAFSQLKPDLTLIWDLISTEDALRTLLGEEMTAQMRQRDLERLVHARGERPGRLQGQPAPPGRPWMWP
ncbi:MAG: type II toxin-antitoxin system prevent-host-death family antitoxin [Actinomycetota bacterium]|nr:type II toxin-antitoxin system prevent-host-death family antitoxin [Actinomycetota bacterium]